MKKVVIIFLWINLSNLLINFIVWHIWTKTILVGTDTKKGGDLTRLGYMSDPIHLRETISILSLKHEESDSVDYEKSPKDYEIVTFGDSFSNGGSGGINAYYQDYIATDYKKNILNVQNISDGNYLNTVVLLANSGFLKKSNTRYVIVESIERSFIDRCRTPLEKNKTLPLNEIERLLLMKHYSHEMPDYSFMNNGNYRFIITNIMRSFSENAFKNDVYAVPLSSQFFSYGNKLLFYKDDIKCIKNYSLDNLKEANENLNKLAKLLKTQNIALIVLVAPNKYTLYGEFLQEPYKYGKSIFFEDYKHLPKEYLWIDSKSILREALLKGEKDLYYVDDTHWSNKASMLISQAMKFLQ